MAAAHTYLITVGTTPVEPARSARRRGRHRAHPSTRLTVPAKRPGLSMRAQLGIPEPADPVPPGGRLATAGSGSRSTAERSTARRPTARRPTAGHRATRRSVGRHRATRTRPATGPRHGRPRPRTMLRAGLSVLLALLICATFASAWYATAGAAAFAGLIH